jgi:fatty aldehyde decarbonylase
MDKNLMIFRDWIDKIVTARRLSKMENRHMKGFQACGRNLKVTPDMAFAKQFFSDLHRKTPIV